MATNWFRVHENICKKYPECKELNNDNTLRHLYTQKGLSLSEITNLSEREILSPLTVRKRLLKLGVKTRGKGGDNSTKNIALKLEEFNYCSVRELARKYDIDESTIRRKKEKLLKEVSNESKKSNR
jgi:hypothetical protein